MTEERPAVSVSFERACAILIAVLIVLRFTALGVSPPGFWRDESAIAAQILCFAQSGHDWEGARWPIYSVIEANYGALTFAPMLYGGAAWVQLFGASVESLRAFAALHGVLAIAGVGVLAALIGGRTLGLVAALICAASPWSFLASRIAWDPPLAPAYLIWGLVFYWLAVENWKSREAPPTSSASGRTAAPQSTLINLLMCLLASIFFSLACYAYPPTRAQFPILWAFLLIPSLMYRRWREYVITTVLLAIWSAPLIRQTLSGELQYRFQLESIFNEDGLQRVGLSGLSGSVTLFWHNLLSHLSWPYLIEKGDSNLRHSTQWSGQWSWVEILSIPVGLLLLQLVIGEGVARTKQAGNARTVLKKTAFLSGETNDRPLRWLPLMLVGVVSGIVPAALTWTGNPHALRSIGSYPFLALMAGIIWWSFFSRARTGSWLFLVALMSSTSLFLADLYFNYPGRALHYFDSIQHSAMTPQREHGTAVDLRGEIDRIDPSYPARSLSYYQMMTGAMSCR